MRRPFQIVAVILLFTALGLGIYSYADSKKHTDFRKEYTEIQKTFVTENCNQEADAKTFDTVAGTKEQEAHSPIEVDFNGLLERNSSVVGWIYCGDTPVNYPVVRGTDNVFYLSHGIDKGYNGYGTVFMDAGNSADFSDPNTVLYAHHMADGSMFAFVADYKKQEYMDSHPVIWLSTPGHNYRGDVYSCYVTTAESDAYRRIFRDDEDYADWLRDTIDKSIVAAEVSPNITARILTLSTCSYEFTGARCVLHGIMTEI